MPTFDTPTLTPATTTTPPVTKQAEPETNVVMMKTGTPMPKDFITRVDLNTMSDKELDDFLDRIRLRRLSSFIVFQQSQADIAEVNVERAKVRIDNELTQILKLLNTLDNQFEKLELRVHKLRGLRIQAGLSIM